MENSKDIGKTAESIVQKSKSNKYRIFLTTTAFLGWTMVVYEWNIFGLLLGPVSKILHLTSSQVGFLLAGIQFIMVPIVFLVGYFIDKVGRKAMYQITLISASILTALTGVATYIGLIPLLLVRSGTQGSAQNEQSVAATMITEEMPARWRALIYSFVQSGWPLGVALAGIVVTFLYKPLGYKYIWLIAVLPMILIIIARHWAKETTRFEEVKKAREGIQDETVKDFTDVKKSKKNTFKQAFEKDIRKYTIWAFLLYSIYLGGQVPIVVLAAYYMEEIIKIPVITTASIITIGAFITIPAYWLNGAISEFIGRRYAGIFGTVMAFIGTFIFAVSAHTYFSLLLAYSFASFWINGNFINIINFVNETVPTRVRGTVNVISTGLGQLSWGLVEVSYAVLIPLIGISYDMVFIAGIAFAATSVLFATGRKVRIGEPLEEISI
ncbi:MFS transporter [Acidiplasma sp.]|jgi:sugar phosphate permease|uniref:MFS transporter n=1 Tax=Acidiplasma sp. TaxID=1872114 RepID=UPI0025833615|nr:MFS transporter [Acidiplasma sp.]